MEIREAQDRDVSAIQNIWNPIVRDTLITFTTRLKTKADLRNLIAANKLANLPFLIATEKNTVLGFATYGPFRGGSGYLQTMEHSIMLAQNSRRSGIGRLLLDALETHARARNIHTLIAAISGENPAAVDFHEACGFVQTGTLPQVGRKFDRWLDLILMQKHL